MKPILEQMLSWFADDEVAGDLLEEFRDERLPKLGRVLAELWYARQIASILWHGIPGQCLLLCLLSALVAGGLLVKETTLQSPGFASRSFDDSLFLVQALLACVAIPARKAEGLRKITTGLTGIALMNAAIAVHQSLSVSRFEGYALVAGALFAVQSIATFRALDRRSLPQ